MMPSAPMMTMTPASKPKIGFSIDSIVGNRIKSKSPMHYSQDSEGSEAPLSPLSDYGYTNQQKSPKFTASPADIQRALRLSEYTQLQMHERFKRSLSTSPVGEQTDINEHHKSTLLRLAEQENQIQRHEIQKHSMSPQSSPQTRLSADESNNRRSRSPPSPISSPPQHMQKGPIVVPGIPAGLIRPSPVGPPNQLPPQYSPEMIQAQNHFFRLGTFKLLRP